MNVENIQQKEVPFRQADLGLKPPLFFFLFLSFGGWVVPDGEEVGGGLRQSWDNYSKRYIFTPRSWQDLKSHWGQEASAWTHSLLKSRVFLKSYLLPLSLSFLICMATWYKEPTHWKSPWYWERLKVRGERVDRGWDGWMASLAQWTWIWANSGRYWRTGKPGMLQFMVLQSEAWLGDLRVPLQKAVVISKTR